MSDLPKFRFVEKTGSTNADFAAQLRSDDPPREGDWLVALWQVAGRGRQGREWFDGKGNFERDGDYQTSESGVFVAGDAGRGQSLIVWAIAEGRACAAAVDAHLTGQTMLPAPLAPTAQPLR